MSHLHHRLRSRRGSNHGRNIHSPSLPPPKPTIPSSSPSSSLSRGQFHGKYLATRSRRGQSHAYGARRMNAATQTTNSPAPPHLSYHLNQFYFHNTLNRPDIIATVIVTFNEEIRPQDEHDAQTHDIVPEKEDNNKQKKVKEKHAISERKHSDNRFASPGCKYGHDNISPRENICGGKHAVEGNSGGTLTDEGIPGGTSATMED